MRHRMMGKHLSRPTNERKALYRSLMAAVITYEAITTTEAKAKAVRPQVEKLITLAKGGTVHHRRLALSRLPHERAVRKLFDIVAPRYQGVNGGYTRLTHLGIRHGDGAPLVRFELVTHE